METQPKKQLLATESEHSLAVFLLIFVIMATGITTIAFTSYRHYEQQFRHQVEDQLSSIATLKVTDLNHWRNERLGDAKILYQNPAFSDLVQRYLEAPADDLTQAELQTWLDHYAAHQQYDRAFLLDTLGTERISSPAPPEPAAGHLLEDMPAILSAGQVTFLDFHHDTAAGDIRLAILIPIFAGQDHHPVGLFGLRIDPNAYLYPYIQRWPVPGQSAETLLIRQEGGEALFLNPLRFRPDAALNLRIPLTSTNIPAVMAILGNEGIVEGADYRGVPVIAAVRSIPDSPWLLVAKEDTAEVYAPLQARLWQTAAFFGLLLVASGAGLMLVWRQQRMHYFRGQVEAAVALRESDQRFRALFEQAAVGVALLETNSGRYVTINQRYCDFLGYALEEMTTSRFQEVTHPDDIQTNVDNNALLLAGKIREFSIDKRYIRKDGTVVWGNLTASPLWAEGEKPDTYFHIAVVQDITDRKQIEAAVQLLNTELEQRVRDRTAQLEAANKELEAFSYSVSHDLRAPLRGIDGFTRILVDEYGDKLDDEGRRVCAIIRDSTQHMGQLIDDLLTFSRLSRTELQKSSIDMKAMVNSIYHEVADAEAHARIDLQIGDIYKAYGDPTLLRQVWVNLLTNAIKFTSKREVATISVSCQKEGDKCVYCVKDNGAGFDMKYVTKLFGVFQRLHSARDFEGTGVGLAIIQRIVHRHGGEVWAEGEVNCGAAFYFSLPVYDES